MSDDITKLKEEEKAQSDPYETVVDSQTVRSVSHRNSNWGAGIALITIGAVFLIANVTSFHLNNWWALFILIPAVANFGNALRNYQNNGRFTRSARGSITGGLILTLVATTFLFDLDWGMIWPVFLIIGGLGALMGARFE